MTRGRFITLEGGEGVGKSTQARLLADALEARGIETVLTREPGGSEGAEAIRGLLLSGAADRWSVRAEALLFAAARADHAERTILPAVEAGKWVICDRFLDSSRAYQGVGGVLSDDDILTLHRIGSGGLLPDRTLLLALPLDESSERAGARDAGAVDRIGGRDAGFHRDVAESFRRFAAAEPARFRDIDASGSMETVRDRLLAALADWLP
ncbi:MULTISPECIES: dTMP kinase [Sphingobium]|uniref:dTMP kinase n=1 Tax=Sphingobium TaxID=165695 RepID=UPI0015EB73F3|nr:MULTISPECIES: dTMP kinase [Sphingobium]MCW2361672.1 dTMP kinase [Sphingobium sp. B10D3B]MCW2401649.1 dTMP kinase [Sphingobium sp. B10D7B]MCW2408629.1 dTMP kinase [Sphingobium xanthum]